MDTCSCGCSVLVESKPKMAVVRVIQGTAVCRLMPGHRARVLEKMLAILFFCAQVRLPCCMRGVLTPSLWLVGLELDVVVGFVVCLCFQQFYTWLFVFLFFLPCCVLFAVLARVQPAVR